MLDTTNSPDENYICGCGWPDHMLIPKGTSEGFRMELFVMISDNKDLLTKDSDNKCKSASSYCGLRGLPYPDKKAMGFPFDRLQDSEPVDDTLSHFLTPNMKTQDIVIKFNDITEGTNLMRGCALK
jgi:tyrosinase